MRYFFVLIVALFLWGTSATTYAQVSVNFNIGVQPVWGPTGYDYAEYYYLPDIDCYYYVPQHRFYYFSRGRWIFGSSLPYQYRNYNLYNSYKVVVNERDPWRNDATYRQKYASDKGRHDQQPIRDSKDSKYFVNPGHPQHNAFVQQQKQNNGVTAPKGNTAPRGIAAPKGNVAPRGISAPKGNTSPRGISAPKGNVAPKGINRAPVTKQNTRVQRPTVTKQNTRVQRPANVRQNPGNQKSPGGNQNKGNGGRGNGNGKEK
jgi:hypothetical protein